MEDSATFLTPVKRNLVPNFKNLCTGGWEDDSVGEGFDCCGNMRTLVKGPKSVKKKYGGVCLESQHWGCGETEGPLGLCQYSTASLVSSKSVRDCQRIRMMAPEEQHLRLTSGLSTFLHMNIPTCAHTKECSHKSFECYV